MYQRTPPTPPTPPSPSLSVSPAADLALDILDSFGVQTFDRSSQLPTLGVGHDRREWIDRETCRRVFYVIYMIELLASVFSHRPLSHQESDVRIYLPIHDHLYELGMEPSFPQRGEAFHSPPKARWY